MRQTITRLALVLTLLVPGVALAGAPQDQENVNTRYTVESVSIAGVSESRVSQALRDDMQKLVGSRYDPAAADALADRMRKELHGYTVSVKVTRGDQAEHVKVIFEAKRAYERTFEVAMAPLLYSTADGVSATLVPGFETHHNFFSFGFTSSADELLERNEGVLLRYEHRKVGTDMVQVGLEYDYFHPAFQPETENALLLNPQVPGIYRTRENFAPSISVLPIPDIKVTFGASFQTLEMQYPAPHDQAANAFTFAAQFRHEVRPKRHVRHAIAADYSVRDATSSLESDFIYTRQLVTADYTLSMGRHQVFGAHFQGGHISGQPLLFERFSIGNTATLRGWDKFDVAPIGGTRLAYGSLEYRYRPFYLFYDFGAVWDAGQDADVKHSVGLGLGWKNGFFMALGVPLRYHGVTPVFMIGFRR
jgi:outer membrane translocation and assembly module TamA